MTLVSLDAARKLSARVRRKGTKLIAASELSSSDWLLLPLAKQDSALRRLEALREYEGVDAPTSRDAMRAARKAGVGAARFYELFAHWKAEGRTVMSLVPHRQQGAERATRLKAEDTARAIRKSMALVLDADPGIDPGRMVSTIRRGWKGPGDLPTDAALRAFHDRLKRSVDPTPGTLTLNVGGQPQENDVVAERFLESLVVDHVAPRALVVEEDGLPPTITLVMDLWSGAAIGAAVTMGGPGPGGVARALDDAARRVTRRGGGPHDGGRGPSRIVLATTRTRGWSALVEALLANGLGVVERPGEVLHQGGPTRRILGMQLGPIRLERLRERDGNPGVDPSTTAAPAMADLERLVAEAVDSSSDRRVPAGAWADASGFDLVAMLGAERLLALERANDAPIARRPGRRPRAATKSDIRTALEHLSRTRAPDARVIEIREGERSTWYLRVAVASEDRRAAAFMALATAAMEITAAAGAPIVVQVEVDDEDEGRDRARTPA